MHLNTKFIPRALLIIATIVTVGVFAGPADASTHVIRDGNDMSVDHTGHQHNQPDSYHEHDYECDHPTTTEATTTTQAVTTTVAPTTSTTTTIPTDMSSVTAPEYPVGISTTGVYERPVTIALAATPKQVDTVPLSG